MDANDFSLPTSSSKKKKRRVRRTSNSPGPPPSGNERPFLSPPVYENSIIDHADIELGVITSPEHEEKTELSAETKASTLYVVKREYQGEIDIKQGTLVVVDNKVDTVFWEIHVEDNPSTRGKVKKTYLELYDPKTMYDYGKFTADREARLQRSREKFRSAVKKQIVKNRVAKDLRSGLVASLWNQIEEIGDIIYGEEVKEIRGETVFQKFPLPEIRVMEAHRNGHKKAMMCCHIFIILTILMTLVTHFKSQRKVNEGEFVPYQNDLIIRSNGCDVNFIHPITVEENQNKYEDSGNKDAASTISQTFNIMYFVNYYFSLLSHISDDVDPCLNSEEKKEMLNKAYCISYIHNEYPFAQLVKQLDPSAKTTDGSIVKIIKTDKAIEIVAFEALNSKTFCKVNVWLTKGLQNVTILQTGREMRVDKVDNSMVHVKETCECESPSTRTFSRGPVCLCNNRWEKTPVSDAVDRLFANRVSNTTYTTSTEIYQYAKNGNWRLDINNLQINATNLDLNMTNVKVKKIAMFIEIGNVDLHGLQINSSGVASCNNGTNAGRCNHTIKIGVDLGKVEGIGKFKYTGNNLCAPAGPKVCEGNLHLTMISPTRIKYSQNNGIVCGAAHGINVEYANCKGPTVSKNGKNSNSSNTSNTNANTNVNTNDWNDTNTGNGTNGGDFDLTQNFWVDNEIFSGTCKGQAVLCNNKNCAANETMETIDASVHGGGLYFAVVNYRATKRRYTNRRRTVDGKPCIFPFTYKNKVYYDCTMEDYDLPWCTTNFDSILDPKRLNEARLGDIGVCSSNCTNYTKEQSDKSANASGSRRLEELDEDDIDEDPGENLGEDLGEDLGEVGVSNETINTTTNETTNQDEWATNATEDDFTNETPNQDEWATNTTEDFTFDDQIEEYILGSGEGNDQWGVCEMYPTNYPLQETIQGFAYKLHKSRNIPMVRFDKKSKALLKSILPFQNVLLNDPIIAPIEMASKTSARGRSFWLYATSPSHLLVRNDALLINSAGLVSARYFKAGSRIRVSPGVCPTEALPDGMLTTQQMGAVSQSLAANIGVSGYSRLAWFGNFEHLPFLRGSTTWTQSWMYTKDGSFLPSLGFLEQEMGVGTMFFNAKSGGGYEELSITDDPLSAAAKFALVLSYSLSSIWFFMSLFIICPALLHFINVQYAQYVRKRRNLSITERRLELEKKKKKRDHKALSNDNTEKKASTTFWEGAQYLNEAVTLLKRDLDGKESNQNASSSKETVSNHSHPKRSSFLNRVVSLITVIVAIILFIIFQSIEPDGTIWTSYFTYVFILIMSLLLFIGRDTAYKNCCKWVLEPPETATKSITPIAELHEKFAMLQLIRKTYRSKSVIERHMIEDSEIKDVFNIAEDDIKLDIYRRQLDYFCDLTSEKVDTIVSRMEIIDLTWLNIERNKVHYVDALTFWEIPVVMYQIFIAPQLKNSLIGFVRDEIINDDYLYHEWFWNQSLLYQYAIVILYIIDSITQKGIAPNNLYETFTFKNFYKFKMYQYNEGDASSSDTSSSDDEESDDGSGTSSESDTDDEANDDEDSNDSIGSSSGSDVETDDELSDESNDSEDELCEFCGRRDKNYYNSDSEDDSSEETEEEKTCCCKLQPDYCTCEKEMVGAYFRFHSIRCFRNYFSTYQFSKTSYMVRGVKELNASSGVGLKKFKLHYEAYCDKKGLKKMPINKESIKRVCEKFGIDYNESKEIFEKVKLMSSFKTTRGSSEEVLNKETFYFIPFCLLVYFFFSSWFFMLFLVYGIIRRFFPVEQILFLCLRISALLVFNLPLFMIVFLYHSAIYEYFTLQFYQVDDFLHRPYMIYSAKIMGFSQFILSLSIALFVSGSIDLLLFYMLGEVNYSARIVYEYKRGEKVLKKDAHMTFVEKYFANLLCCKSKNVENDKNNKTDKNDKNDKKDKNDNTIRPGVPYEVVHLNVQKDGSVAGYQIREDIVKKIPSASYRGIFKSTTMYQLGDIVSADDKNIDCRYQLINTKLFRRKSRRASKLGQEIENAGIISYKWEERGWKRIYTVTMKDIVPNYRLDFKNIWYFVWYLSKFLQTTINILFYLFLALAVSFVLAYLSMVLTWWVLGAVVNPERILAFASAVVVFLGTIKQMVADLKNMKQEAMKKIKLVVEKMIQDIIAKSSSMTKAMAENVKLPKLPGAFASLNMNALQIYTLVRQDGGVKKLSDMVIEASFQEFMTKERIKKDTDTHALVMIVQELVKCLLLKKSEQLNAFGLVASKMILLLLNSGGKNKENTDEKKLEDKKRDTEIIHKLLQSIITLGIDTKDNVNVRRAINSFEDCFFMITEKENIQAEFMQYIFTFLKLVTADLKILRSCMKRVINLFDDDPETGKNDKEQLIIRAQNVSTNLVKLTVSFSLLHFMNVIMKNILLKGKIKPGEDFFDTTFVEKFESEFFKFVEITYKSNGKISEIERAGENIIKIFVNDSMKKLKDNVRQNEGAKKICKSSVEAVVRPLGKEIVRSTGQMLHQIIEDTTSKGNVQKRKPKAPEKTSAGIIKYFKNILSHIINILSDNTVNAGIAKEAYAKFLITIWQPLQLDKTLDMVQPIEKSFQQIFMLLATFVKGKTVDGEDVHNIKEVERKLKNEVCAFFLNMFFGNQKGKHDHLNKHLINGIMGLDIIKKLPKTSVKKLITQTIEIFKSQMYMKLCDEKMEEETVKTTRLEKIKKATEPMFKKLEGNIKQIQDGVNKAQSDLQDTQSILLGILFSVDDDGEELNKASKSVDELQNLDFHHIFSTYIDMAIDVVIQMIQEYVKTALHEIKSWRKNSTKKKSVKPEGEIEPKNENTEGANGATFIQRAQKSMESLKVFINLKVRQLNKAISSGKHAALKAVVYGLNKMAEIIDTMNNSIESNLQSIQKKRSKNKEEGKALANVMRDIKSMFVSITLCMCEMFAKFGQQIEDTSKETGKNLIDCIQKIMALGNQDINVPNTNEAKSSGRKRGMSKGNRSSMYNRGSMQIKNIMSKVQNPFHMKVFVAFFISIFGIPNNIISSLRRALDALFLSSNMQQSKYTTDIVDVIFETFFNQESILELQKTMRVYIQKSVDNCNDSGNEMKEFLEFVNNKIIDTSKNIANAVGEKAFKVFQKTYFPDIEASIINGGKNLMVTLYKLPTMKDKTVAMKNIISQFLDSKYRALNDPKQAKEKKKIVNFIEKCEEIRKFIKSLRLDKTKTTKISKEEKYRRIFKEVDTSGDGLIDFDEFTVLVNGTLSLGISPQRLKDMFSMWDTNNGGALDIREFEKAMEHLEDEITKSAIRKIGLSEHTVYPALFFLGVYMIGILAFILMGFAAFTAGTAFSAGIGSMLPLVAGKSAGLGNFVKNIDFEELVGKVLKTDFQGKEEDE